MVLILVLDNYNNTDINVIYTFYFILSFFLLGYAFHLSCEFWESVEFWEIIAGKK